MKSHAQLAETANNLRIISQNLFNATIELNIKTIMVVTKPGDSDLVRRSSLLVNWLLWNYDVCVYVDLHMEKYIKLEGPEQYNSSIDTSDFQGLLKIKEKKLSRLRFWSEKDFAENSKFGNLFDLAITLGGDGTVLYVSQLFQQFVPPVIAFALGLLGFLTNFKFKNYQKILRKVLRLKYVKINLRMRLSCKVVNARTQRVRISKNVLNEVTIDRGSNPFLTNLALYGNDSFITVAQADGLCIATPTGLTAYSLAAGGSLVHSSVSAISVTPICPHTLSFRPIILPDSMELKVMIPRESRCSTACLLFDGKFRVEMGKHDYLVISACEYAFPTVMNGNNEYFESVSKNLNWNSRKQQKPLKFDDIYDYEDTPRQFLKDSVESLIDTIYSEEEDESDDDGHLGGSFLEESDDDSIETPTIPFQDINEALEIFSDEERPSPGSKNGPPFPMAKSRSGLTGASLRFRTNSFSNFNQLYRDKIHLDKKKEKSKLQVKTGEKSENGPKDVVGKADTQGHIVEQVVDAPPKDNKREPPEAVTPVNGSRNEEVLFEI